MLPSAMIQTPEALAERLWTALVRPIEWQEEECHLVVVAGVVRNEDRPGTAKGLIQAGYAAAKDGLAHDASGGVKLFTLELGQRIEHRYRVAARWPATACHWRCKPKSVRWTDVCSARKY